MTANERYQWACTNDSDIAGLIPMMMQYGKQCERITEFGVRGGVSTSAWLMAAPRLLTCYDEQVPGCLNELSAIAREQNVEFLFIQQDTKIVSISETDLLFLDTLHTEAQVRLELRNHDRVAKYIVLHDTETWGEIGEDREHGIMFAVRDFLVVNPQWITEAHYRENNGLTILKRI